ncbi:MAG: hypothetical protein AB1798_13790, partial [Spirochaetota bacterium]
IVTIAKLAMQKMGKALAEKVSKFIDDFGAARKALLADENGFSTITGLMGRYGDEGKKLVGKIDDATFKHMDNVDDIPGFESVMDDLQRALKADETSKGATQFAKGYKTEIKVASEWRSKGREIREFHLRRRFDINGKETLFESDIVELVGNKKIGWEIKDVGYLSGTRIEQQIQKMHKAVELGIINQGKILVTGKVSEPIKKLARELNIDILDLQGNILNL